MAIRRATPVSEGITPRLRDQRGLSGDREVWLCCLPVEEILSHSFRCEDSLFPALFGDNDYTKIRYCSLAHPTSTEPRYIPVCIPAPLRAPGLDP